MWDRRAPTWEHAGAAGLDTVIDCVLRQAEVRGGERALDLGCGTGQLTLPLARRGAAVTAVDVSGAMVARLLEQVAAEGLDEVRALVMPIEQLALLPESLDLVVSNYALHHLRDRDKALLVAAAARWLRPGGRLVVGDMMFGRGATARDRRIISSKVAVLVRRGPAGWWRVLKAAVRFTLRLQERPVSIETWRSYLEGAGFEDVAVMPVVAEAAVIVGTKPDAVADPARLRRRSVPTGLAPVAVTR